MTDQTKTKILMVLFLAAIVVIALPQTEAKDSEVVEPVRQEEWSVDPCGLKEVICEGEQTVDYTMKAYVTGYNTVPEQTDDSPCWAGGYYICGRDDVVACPRNIEKETWVRIEGKEYQCLDRTAKKYNDRFDISCDKDMECPGQVTGWAEVEILKDYIAG